VTKDEEAAATYCPNRRCPAQIARLVQHFTSRGAMDIEGFGEKLAFRLTNDEPLIRTLADIYTLPDHRDELLALDRIGEKKLDGLFANIAASKRRPLRRLLVGLGIRHIGQETALAVRFGTMAALREATVDELDGIDGVGTIIAESLYDYLRDPDHASEIDRLGALGLRMDDEVSARGGPLEGESIVATGALVRWSRNEVETLIKELGGRVGNAVTKSTTKLVTGDGGGAKHDRAVELETPILTEDEFVTLLRKRGWEEQA
jgi:DNA ligase (NAD+)